MHEEYCELFESILAKFLNEHSMSTIEFYKLLKDEQSLADRKGNRSLEHASFASVLLSYTDFFEFCEMMHDIDNGGEAVSRMLVNFQCLFKCLFI